MLARIPPYSLQWGGLPDHGKMGGLSCPRFALSSLCVSDLSLDSTVQVGNELMGRREEEDEKVLYKCMKGYHCMREYFQKCIIPY
jgi:hypothetical protein